MVNSGGSLDDYGKKRDFGRTPEPPGARPDARRGEPVFVVHRHEARRLHYDLRLEQAGVLMSWAVPKGFSYDPQDKRLAVRTEDHPLEYETFDGMIPAGEYGAGAMTIWDHGSVRYIGADDALEKGDLKLILDGRKLRGEWHLVRTKQDGGKNWLLFKSRDCYSGSPRDSVLGVDLTGAPRADLPKRLQRSKPSSTVAPFSDPDWLFEMGFEGRRVFVEKQGDDVHFRGMRSGLDELAAQVAGLRAENALVDGVLVVADENDRPSRELLDRRLAGETDDRLLLYAFDLLHFDAFDLRSLPLVDRKAALRAVLPEHGSVLYVDHVVGDGEHLVEAVAAAGLPSVIAKRLGAPHRGGATDDWREVRVEGAADGAGGSVSDALEARAGAPTSRVRFTNLDKVFWPAEGYTKGDLVSFYEQVADVLLPYLRDRPIHMNRFPDGIDGKSFYQRHANEHVPDWIPTVMVPRSSDDKPTRSMLCNDRDALLHLANLGSIDIHPWLSRKDSFEQIDWGIIDLDPKSAPFSDVVRIARAIGRLLHGIGLRPCLKTSGKTGLHIHVPLVAGYSYEQARLFCETVARVVSRELKEIATVERTLGSRGGRVYVDYGQNRMGATVVPPYSVRPVPGATVSTPLHWDELDFDLSPSQFTIRTVPDRLQRHGDLFRPTLTDPQDLVPALAALEETLRRD